MNNSKFGSRPYDDKSRLSSQLKFFGAKKQGFISVYAKKPRILVKVKAQRNIDSSRITNINYNDSRREHIDRQMSALYNQSMLQGVQNSARSHAAMAQIQACQSALGMQSGQFGGSMLALRQQSGLIGCGQANIFGGW